MPNQFTPVVAVAGDHGRRTSTSSSTGSQPGAPLPLTDDGSVILALPFRFHMCGTAYEEIVVNANGTVSFGAPNPDFSDSVPEFLAGPPQIAGLWDDLNPAAGGTVTFEESRSAFTVKFIGVPERTGGRHRGRREHVLDHAQAVAQPDRREVRRAVRAGRPGGRHLRRRVHQRLRNAGRSEREVPLLDQPAVPAGRVRAVRGADADRAGIAERSVEPDPALHADDRLLRPVRAERIAGAREAGVAAVQYDPGGPVHRAEQPGRRRLLPLQGQGRPDHRRGDPRAARSTPCWASTTAPPVTLVAADDDSGPGTLSRIRFRIPVDGEYAVAVSSFPDFEFDGGGEGGIGRYVLDIHVEPPASTTTTQLELPAGPFERGIRVEGVHAAGRRACRRRSEPRPWR